MLAAQGAQRESGKKRNLWRLASRPIRIRDAVEIATFAVRASHEHCGVASRRGNAGRFAALQTGKLYQSRVELARVQPSRPGRGAGPGSTASGAVEISYHFQLEPRRV